MAEGSSSVIINRYKQLFMQMNQLTPILEPELLLEAAVKAAAALGEAEAAWILVPDISTNKLYYRSTSFNFTQAEQDLTVPVDSSLEGWVYLSQQPYTIENINLYEGSHGNFFGVPGIRIESSMLIPGVVKGKTVLIMGVANKLNASFTPLDLEILSLFTQHAALCFGRARYIIQSNLIAELVHELRTPLASLNTALNLLQRTDLPIKRREQVSEMIQTEFSRLTDLTTSFLDFARLESGKEKFKPARFDLIQLIDEAVEIIQMQFDDRQITIVHHSPGEPLSLTADRDKIKQVLLNLLNNAAKYNHPGGKIFVAAQSSPGSISFSVQDDAGGIAPEFLPLLFERFYRMPNTERQVKGTGLGLAICKHIVEAHQGKIEVSSTVGEGTTFTVTLPRDGTVNP